MFWFKACPRCKGDLYEGSDIYGAYVCCLQCARCLTVEEEDQLKLNTPTQGRHSGRPARQRQAA